MNRLKCVVIDDEPFALEIIAEDIAKIPFLVLIGKFVSPLGAVDILDKTDLIFLDIQMPSQSGISFLKTLKNPPMVIFTTAHQQYALQGYDLKVIDYLLKPFSFERLLKAVNYARELHVLKNTFLKEKKHLFVFSEYKQLKIDISEILYIEGLKDYVKIFLKNQDKPLLTRLNIKGILSKLPGNDFCRVHNSFIVSLTQVKSYQKNVIFIGLTKIPIGAKYLDNFIRKIEL